MIPLLASSGTLPRAALIGAVLLAASGLASPPAVAQPKQTGKIERLVTPGGIEAWVMRNPASKMLYLRFSFDGGSAQDPPEKLGLAFATAYMFDEGAGDLDTQAFSRARNAIAADLGAGLTGYHFNGTLSAPGAYRGKAFDLLRLALMSPRFDTEPMTRMSVELRTRLEGAERNPHSIVTKAMIGRLYPGHRFSHWDEGTLETIKSLTADDMRAYRARVLTRDGLRVAVVSDLESAELATLIDKAFGGLPAKGDRKVVAIPTATPPGQQIIDLDLPQSIVSFQRTTRRLNPREAIAAALLSSILSDNFTGRLFVEVREKRGLVYGISAAYNQGQMLGAFSGQLGSGPQTTFEALKAATDVLDEMAKSGPTEEEFTAARRALLGRLLFSLENSAAIAGRMLWLQEQGLPITYLDDLTSVIESLTREEVAAVARELIDTRALHVVIAGRPTRP